VERFGTKRQGPAVVVMKLAVDSGEGGGQGLTLLLVAVPKQIEVSGQFSGAVHDASDLSDHDGVDTGLVRGSVVLNYVSVGGGRVRSHSGGGFFGESTEAARRHVDGAVSPTLGFPIAR
jgi:hypothetical protein